MNAKDLESAKALLSAGEFIAVNDSGACGIRKLHEIPEMLRDLFGFYIHSNDGVEALFEAGLDVEELMQKGFTSMGVGSYDLRFYKEKDIC